MHTPQRVPGSHGVQRSRPALLHTISWWPKCSRTKSSKSVKRAVATYSFQAFQRRNPRNNIVLLEALLDRSFCCFRPERELAGSDFHRRIKRPFALPSTIHWVRGLAIASGASDICFATASRFYASVQRRVMTDREINLCEQMLFALHQVAALTAIELAPNKADVARIGIVACYYGIYGAASAMIAAGDGSFPDTHAATAQQWDRQFAATGLVMPPFADRISNLTDAEVTRQLAVPRSRSLSVAEGCRLTGIARSTYYDRPRKQADDTAIVEAMFTICDEFEFYGYRRVGAAPRQQGLVVNHKKIRRLMGAHDLQPKVRRRFIATTDGDHDGPIFPNLAMDFVPTGPNQLWVADITYVAVPGRFVYVAIVLDAWSRLLVGYAIGRSIDARLTTTALTAAIERRKPPPGLIHHSDRGGQ